MKHTEIYMDSGCNLAVKESCDEIRKLVSEAFPTSLKHLTGRYDGVTIWIKPWHIIAFKDEIEDVDF